MFESLKIMGCRIALAKPPTASRLKGPRKQKSFAYKLLKRGLANLMSPTSTSGVAPPLLNCICILYSHLDQFKNNMGTREKSTFTRISWTLNDDIRNSVIKITKIKKSFFPFSAL
ncbi:hypothetical protein EVAR_8100_1 [Eumeta japonica]|uniref:Uncharacterized protein n=1 Tax=Eumeta variegata TaxID=151549 RepID=A0A4C1TT02_EUMVA|nr:hypothetical protein EVAR_8100_1 [Eumeta japonica]